MSAVLHHQVHELLVLKVVVKSDNVSVFQLAVEFNLFFNLKNTKGCDGGADGA